MRLTLLQPGSWYVSNAEVIHTLSVAPRITLQWCITFTCSWRHTVWCKKKKKEWSFTHEEWLNSFFKVLRKVSLQIRFDQKPLLVLLSLYNLQIRHFLLNDGVTLISLKSEKLRDCDKSLMQKHKKVPGFRPNVFQMTFGNEGQVCEGKILYVVPLRTFLHTRQLKDIQ